jgi:Uma2 family endonuclease
VIAAPWASPRIATLPSLRANCDPRGVKLTYDDFVLFPDDGLRHELIDGEHYVTPSPSARHQDLVVRLTLGIGNWVEQNQSGQLYVAPFDVVFSEIDVIEPDVLYMSKARANAILKQGQCTRRARAGRGDRLSGDS